MALEEARAFLAEAEALRTAGFPGPALRSAYYAADYAARGLALARGLAPEGHRSIVRGLARMARRDGWDPSVVGDLALLLAGRWKSERAAGFRLSRSDAAWGVAAAQRVLDAIEAALAEP